MKTFFNSLLLGCLFLLLHPSCGQTPTGINLPEINLPPSQILKINLDEDLVVLPQSAIFETVNYIKLETTSDCLIGSISKLLYINDTLIIMDGSDARPILTFSNTGKFLHKIGDYGPGPKEYSSPSDIAYDPYNDELIVWSYNDRKILRYRLDGEFVSAIQLDFWISSIVAYDKDIMLAYVNNLRQASPNSKNYHFLFMDKKGEILSVLDEYNPEKDVFAGPSSHVFSPYNNDISFYFPSTNSVYKVHQDSIQLHYFIDFGKYNMPLDFLHGKKTREAYNELSESDLGFIRRLAESDKYLFTVSEYKTRQMHTLFSKQTQQQISYDLFLHNDKYLSFTGPGIIALAGDLLIGMCEAAYLESTKAFYSELLPDTSEEHIRKLTLHKYSRIPDKMARKRVFDAIEKMPFKYNQADYDFLSSIDPDDNPIIFVGKIRSKFPSEAAAY